ncbi:MAG TPA: diaminopimelate decarboxylase [Tepidisphaeraceae bacterium]|jgi:diaminopimelate decarboxylase|nr:diaminopimelate decarboxylase [Tepidisphaeraceae bacterium]
MDYFNYKNGELYCEDVPVARIAAEVGTAVYIYSKATLVHHYRQIADAFKALNPTICYSIKSNGNINLCKVLAAEGCGFDVTSGGELFRALQAGGDPKKMIYAGVGKTDQEIIDAINAGIAAFNLESEAEIENIDRVAASIGKQAVGAIRINPDVDPGAKTHAKTTTGKKETKFGVDIERAERVFEQYRNLKNLRIAGVHIHIGSPIYDVQPYVDAVTKIIALIDRLTAKGHKIEWFDVGGGFGVNYEHPEQALPVTEHAKALVPLLQGKPYRIAFEPGRYIAGNSGILVTKVLYRKTGGEKKFVIVDAGMNDLIRPTLYESYHHIWPVHPDAANQPKSRSKSTEPVNGEVVDVVGPICESGDYLAKARPLPTTQRGDLLAVFTAGAYGFAMSSNYNNRPRLPEVLVDGDSYKVIRRRETFEDLVAAERIQPRLSPSNDL